MLKNVLMSWLKKRIVLLVRTCSINRVIPCYLEDSNAQVVDTPRSVVESMSDTEHEQQAVPSQTDQAREEVASSRSSWRLDTFYH